MIFRLPAGVHWTERCFFLLRQGAGGERKRSSTVNNKKEKGVCDKAGPPTRSIYSYVFNSQYKMKEVSDLKIYDVKL